MITVRTSHHLPHEPYCRKTQCTLVKRRAAGHLNIRIQIWFSGYTGIRYPRADVPIPEQKHLSRVGVWARCAPAHRRPPPPPPNLVRPCTRYSQQKAAAAPEDFRPYVSGSATRYDRPFLARFMKGALYSTFVGRALCGTKSPENASKTPASVWTGGRWTPVAEGAENVA